MAQAQIDSAALAKRVDSQATDSNAIIQAVTDSYRQIQDLGSVRVEAVRDAGAADAVVVGAKEVGELRRQEAAVTMATALGSNLSDAAEVITALGLKARSDFSKAEVARKEYYKTQQSGFFDDPLGYIVNNFMGGTEAVASKYNEAAQEYNATVGRLDTIAAQTTAHAQAQAAIAQTRTAASVEAAATSVTLKAADQAIQIKQQNLLYNVQGLETVQKLNAQQLSNLFQLNSAVMSEKHLALAAAQLKLSTETHKIALEERLQRIEERKDKKESLETLGATVNLARNALGLAEMPPSKAYSMMQIGGPVGEAIKEQYAMGANIESFGRPFVSDNPGTAARLVMNARAPLSAAMKPVRDMITTAYDDTLKSNKIPGLDKKDPRQVDAAATAMVREIATSMAANIKSGDATNIYAAPTISSITEVAPGVKDTAFFKNVLSDVAPSLPELNPSIALNLARAGVQSKKITFQEAVEGITILFNGAVATNNATKDYLRVGVKPQVGFNTTLDAKTSLYAGGIKVNMADPVSVSNALSKSMIPPTPFNPSSGVGGFR